MPKPSRHRRPLIEALEPRLLFSATADIAVFDDGHADGQNLAHAAEQLDLLSIYQPDDALPFAEMSGAEPAPADDADDTAAQADIVFNDDPAITTLVFVDTGVDNYEALVSDIQDRVDASSVAIIYLDSGGDGLGQISDYLAGFSGISAIHIISHGVAGNLQLGSQVLNENNLTQFKAQLEGWQTALDPDADILLYGCELAANQSGLNFLQQLGDLTGADVAASNDLTGNSRADADWELEAQVGQIETASIFSSAHNMQWQGVLADVVHLYSGAATNEQAIPAAGYVMQGVQLTSSQMVDRIQVMLANHGTSSTTVQMLVHQHSYNGTVVASATVNTATLGSSLGWVNFDFAQTSFNAYTVYWVEFKTDNGADNLVGIGYVNSNVIASEFVVNGSGDGNKDMSIALVDAENRVPTVANAIANQVATEEAMFSYTFAANTFNDQDGDALTYTATRADGTPLPAWLNFNAATRTFSGVPDDGDVGTLTIKLTASDGKGGTVDDWFDLAVNNVNDDPFLNIPVSNQNATEDSAFTYTFPANTFGDGDVGASLTYTAELADGSALPAWLHLDSATLTFSGTPANADVGTISVKLIANDGAGGIASDTFDIVVANTNDAPVVANAIADQFATENSLFNYSFPTNTFGDPDVGDTLTYSAHIAGALPLPGWLNFDAATRTFSGTPSNGDVGSYTLRVTATDGSGSFTTHDFDIVVQNVGSTNSIIDSSGSTIHSQVLSPGAKIYQSFTNDFDNGTYTIDSIILQLKKDASAAAQTITVSLIAGAYNGTVIDTATISSSALDTSLTWKAFDFTNTVLSDSIVYFIAVETTGSDGLVAVGIHNINAYPDGNLFYNSGTPDLDRDLAFQVASGTNTDPVLMNPIPAQNATEDSAFNFQFASNTFSDADIGDVLTYTATLDNGDPLPTWLSFNAATRTFSGTPTNADVGTLSIKVTADDGNGGTLPSDTFDLVIANTNDAPTVANPIPNQNATEDSAFNFTFAANTFADQDVGNLLTYTAQLANGGALPSWLSFDAATRTFSGTPTNAFVGTVSIDVIASDGNGGTVTDTFNIVVTNTNDAPTVANTIPNQNATEDMAFNFQFDGSTFSDPDTGDVLSYSAQAAGGGALPSWLNFNAATRTFSGTPANADVGSFSIDVIASDGNGGWVTDTFSITVANVNDAPSVSIALTDYYADEKTPINLHGTGITLADVDSSNITLTLTGSGIGSELTASAGTTGVSIFSGNGTSALVLTGTLTQLNNFLAGNNGGTLTYRMAGDAPAATSTLTISASDGALSGNDTAIINIAAVNDAPTVTITPTTYNATEQTWMDLHATGISVADVDGDTLTVTLTGAGTNSNFRAAVGTTGATVVSGIDTNTLVLSGTAAQLNDLFAGNNGGTLTYLLTGNTPVSSVLLTITADDGVLQNSDTATINITAVNDAPVNTVPGAQVTTEDTALVFSASNSNQIQVNDFDVAAGNLEITLSVTNGTLTLAGTTGLSFTTGDGTADSSMVFRGTMANINAALATLTFNPTANFAGSSVLTITTSDLGNTGSGGTLTDTDTVNITVNGSNDAPTIANAITNQNATEDAAFNFQFAANTFADTDGDTLTYSAQLAGGGALPSWLNFNAATRTFSGTPANGDVGTISIDVIASDGNGGTVNDTFNIVIANTNDAPTVANAIPNQNATEDAAFNFQFAANTFADVDAGATLTYSAQLNGGGALPAWLSFDAATRTFSGTPANGDVGTISIDVIASDGNGGTVTDSFNIVIANTNDAPTVANAIPNQNATEDAAFNFQFAANTFADVDAGATLTYSAQLNSGGALPSWLNFNAATRTFSGIPAAADVGTISIDVIANDGNGGTVTDTFTFTVIGATDNEYIDTGGGGPFDPVSSTNQLGQSFAFDSPGATYTVNEISLHLARYDAAQAQTITVELRDAWNGAIIASDSIASSQISRDGFEWHTFSFAGVALNDQQTYVIQISSTGSDGLVLVGRASGDVFAGGAMIENGVPNASGWDLAFKVAKDDGTNAAPVIDFPIADQMIDAELPFNLVVPANTSSDPDPNDTITYRAQLAGGGSLGWLTFNEITRTFSGTPHWHQAGTITVELIATDNHGASTSDFFDITVVNTNNPPTVANPISDQVINEDAAFSFQFDANTFADADGNPLMYSADLAVVGGLPPWLSFDPATRTFSGTPANGDVGNWTIEVTADDGFGGTVTDTFVLTVANTNDAPTILNPIGDQTIFEDQAFNFQFVANTFADVDLGTVFTYSAQLAGGGALPAWLNFDAATRTFSGTPANGDVGTIAIDVIANDGNGGTVTDSFNIVVINTNDVPVVANPIVDQNATEDSAFSFQFAANTFSDADGNPLAYTAQLAGGGALPAWLSFDAATRTFSGTPTNGDVGTLSIAVVANDGNGGTVTDSFNIVIANTNDAPVVASLIPDQTANEDAAFSFQVAANTFTDVDFGTVFTYSAQLAGGGALPAWLSFDAATRTFSGTPASGDIGTIAIDVIASDGDGAAVYDTFNIRVVNTNDAPRALGLAPVNNQEDAAGNSVDLWAGFSDEESPASQLQYRLVSNSNPALVASAVIDPATGKLQLQYGAHQFGTSDLVIRAQDPQGAWVETSLRVTIASVNDMPTSTGIADMQVTAGTAPQQTNLRAVFSDIEQGTQLQYALQGNSNPAIVPQVQIDAATGIMTLTFSSAAGGESIITLRALDADGAWVETQFKVTVAAAAVEIPVMPPPPDTSSPTAPPVLPPIETPVLTPPEVNPPGMGGGTGGGAGSEPTAPGDALNPVVPIASFPLGSEMNGDGYDRDLQNKSSLDYLRAEEALGQRDISLMTLAPTTALDSLITPDTGFAPWETADFDSEVRRMRAQMDEAMDEEQERKAVVAGLTFSVTTGLLIWALRASTLLLTMMSMLPLWRGFDPLPILDEVDKKKKELEQQRKDREREDKNAKEVGYLFDHAQNRKSRP